MGIGDLESIFRITGDLRMFIITFHGKFFDRILDLVALFVLGNILKVSGPVLGLLQLEGFNLFAVREKGDLHAVRTNAVTILIIFPMLGHGNRDRLDFMGVGDGKPALGISADLGFIPVHFHFFKRILDLFAVFVPIDFLKDAFPVFILVQLKGFNLFAVRK